jgi:hypothetical protein
MVAVHVESGDAESMAASRFRDILQDLLSYLKEVPMLPFVRWSLAVLLAVLPSLARAENCRSDRSAPDWVAATPRGYQFNYFVGQAEDPSSPVKAKELAVSNAISIIVANGLISVETSTNTNRGEASTTTKENGKETSRTTKLISDVSEEVRITGHSTLVQGLEQMESYNEQCASYSRAYVLVRIPKATPENPPGWGEPVWRSAIGPGWGQFYKGSTAKGVVIAAGEVIAVPSAIVLYVMSSNDAADARKSAKQTDRNFFQDRSDKLYVGSLVAGGIAIALYAYNLIDAIAAPYPNVYADGAPPAMNGPRFAVVPTKDGALALASFKF